MRILGTVVLIALVSTAARAEPPTPPDTRASSEWAGAMQPNLAELVGQLEVQAGLVLSTVGQINREWLRHDISARATHDAAVQALVAAHELYNEIFARLLKAKVSGEAREQLVLLEARARVAVNRAERAFYGKGTPPYATLWAVGSADEVRQLRARDAARRHTSVSRKPSSARRPGGQGKRRLLGWLKRNHRNRH